MEFILFVVAMVIVLSGLEPALKAGNLQMVGASAAGLLLCAGVYLFARRQGAARTES